MLSIPIYQIDTFTSQAFQGNAAAVCPLTDWIEDSMMQAIAAENNLSETAFFVEEGECFHIRWFTPTQEVDLCGHATLASAYVLFESLNYSKDKIVFMSKSGELSVNRQGDWLTLDFPAQPPKPCVMPDAVIKGLGGIAYMDCLCAEDYMVVLKDETEVRQLEPNFEVLKAINLRGVIITAASNEYDFVTRFFAPKYGIDEDPVTGSAYTQLMPYWSKRLEKSVLNAKQVSARGGEVHCKLVGERVLISGQAIKFLQGEIYI